ncbi:MAG: UDP-N-acetylmuramate dehydrogenase [Phycisphaerales bacterium]|nr:UDP-N-acetylmuramate dehydrogenase [Phycisphaerales bacterium]
MVATLPPIATDAPIPTWFGVGGPARRLAKPETVAQLAQCLELDPAALILGDGANLLVADAGVQPLVISLKQGEFDRFTIGQPDPRGNVLVDAGAGVHLFKLINATTDAGLAGLENLAGIPACLGGAVVMNAGGKYGAIADHIASVTVMDRATRALTTLKRAQIDFGYRASSIARSGAVVTAVQLRLKRSDPATVKRKLKEVTEYKKSTQPMSANSAGCAFKNPVLSTDLPGIAVAGSQVSAGMLIDRAGCKGMRHGTAEVSTVHGNFITAAKGGKADDVIALMRQVQAKVQAAFSVTLKPEVVIWGDTL